MQDCKPYEQRSQLPDYAKSAHGNLSEQNRGVGPVRGIVSLSSSNSLTSVANNVGAESNGDGEKIAKAANCFACHGLDSKLLGPSFKEVSKRYGSDTNSAALLAGRIKNGAQGVWGAYPYAGKPAVAR